MNQNDGASPPLSRRPRTMPPLVNGKARLIVKFRDDVEIPHADEAEKDLQEPWRLRWLSLFGTTPFIHLNRMYSGAQQERLDALVERARSLDARYVPPRFRSFYVVEVEHDRDLSALQPAIADWAIVEMAYWDSPLKDATVEPADDDAAGGWVTMQGYLDPAPDGIDAEFAWPRRDGSGFLGGDGAGVEVIELEQGWNWTHPDLIDHGISLIHGSNNAASRDHGNATLGVLCARDNAIGCVGIAPWLSKLSVVSHFNSTTDAALLAAIGSLAAGDVIVISAMADVVVGDTTWFGMPVEALQATAQLIRLAVALGIIVVEAAGNSWENLDDFVDTTGQRTLYRADPSLGFQDSGAILVSAATSTVPHAPMFMFTDRIHHYGSRVDCYAWGENVTTLNAVSYLSGFANTSAATPIVAGAAIVLQGVAKSRGRLVGPLQMRTILSDPNNGTPSANGPIDGLGVMPDLRKILQANDVLALLPDIYLRDFVGDNGDPHLGNISASPDVIVVPTQSYDPATDFADPTVSVGGAVEIGHDNFVYLRVWNRGSAAADNVTGTVYWAESSTLVTPEQWHLLGTTVLPTVPPGNVPTLSPAIVWLKGQLPAAGHYCFVALIDHPRDSTLGATALGALNWVQFNRFVRNNNNVTWRNFNVITVPHNPDPGAMFDLGEAREGVPRGLNFIVAGAPDHARDMQVIVVAPLPPGSFCELDLPLCLRDWATTAHFPITWESDTRFRVRLKSVGTVLDKLRLPARARLRMELLPHLSSPLESALDVFVSQSHAGLEVGRVTWNLVPRFSADPLARDSRLMRAIKDEKLV